MSADIDAVKALVAESINPEANPEVADELESEELDGTQNDLEIDAEGEATPGDSDDSEESGEEELETTGETDNEVTDEGYTMKSLADAIEIDQGELYNVMVPLRDGDAPISIGEMKNQYQDMIKDKGAQTSKIEELERRVTEGAGANQQAQEMSQQEFMAKSEMMNVQAEFQNTNWAEEEQDDPGEAALKRQKLQERFQNAQGFLQQAEVKRNTDYNIFIAEQNVKLLESIPEWKDNAVRATEQAAIRVALVEAGYTQEVANTVDDPISLTLMKELMMYRKKFADSADQVKLLKTKPKKLKTRPAKKVNKSEAVDKAVNTANKSGKKKDQLAALRGLLAS